MFLEEMQISCFCRESNPGLASRQYRLHYFGFIEMIRYRT
jgi:hypothetical protein